LLRYVLKAPIIAADLGTIGLICAIGLRVTTPRWALAAGALYSFSPAVLLDGVLWGQTDGIWTFFVVLALFLALRECDGPHDRSTNWAGLGVGNALGLAVVLKPQPIIFVPLLVIYLVRRGGIWPALRAVGAMVATCVVVCFPYLLPLSGARPELLAFADAVRGDLGGPQSMASVSAYNAWWLLGLQAHPSATSLLGSLSPSTLGQIVFVLTLALCTAAVWRRIGQMPHAEMLFLAAAVLAFAFFDVTTEQRVRYSFPAVALLMLTALYQRRYATLSSIVSVTLVANAVITMLLAPTASHTGLERIVDLSAVEAALLHLTWLSRIVAAANVGVLITAAGSIAYSIFRARRAETYALTSPTQVIMAGGPPRPR
jgi:hypothetical protein